MIETLQRGWNKNLNDIFQSVEKELIISSPYISNVGAGFLIKNVSENFKKKGILKFVTDLSPKCIYQGSTDPNSFKHFFDVINSTEIFHLPRLHAKVYVSDMTKAIITSGNLTAGGIYNNFEYGIYTQQKEKVSIIRSDLLNYASLGATINSLEINNYCEVAEEVKKLYQQREKSAKIEIEKKFKIAVAKANDELIKARLSEGALHSVFEKTILYLLQRNGSLPTQILHNLIEEIHPDLCNNDVDRVINGVRFGKKWKHAVRTAQQHLKKKGLIELISGNWTLTK